MTQVRLVLLLLMALSTSACERGCARRYAERVLGPGGGDIPRIGGDLPPSAACPEGLARCSSGRVSAAGRLPPDTRCSPEGCRCPWDDLGVCARGCVAEGLELDVARARALSQLCAPPPNATFALAVPPGSLPLRVPIGRPVPTPPSAALGDDEERGTEEPTADIACEIEKYRCDHGVVFRCEGGAVSLFRCVQDCAEEGGTVLAAVSPAEAAALLCRR
jgi:hypothetical protein